MPARRRGQSSTSVETQIANQAVSQLMRSPQGRAFLAIAIIGVLLFLAGQWLWRNAFRVHHPVGPTVRLATWNLREFSDRPNIDLRKIAGIIQQSHFDLLAIQEVKQDGEEVDRLLNVLGPPWRGCKISAMTGNHERFAFIYDGDQVQEIGSPHFIDASDASVFDRVPYQQTFKSGSFDFTLITVHLSYGDTHRRQHEAQVLSQYAQHVAGTASEKDVIVLGDFNEQGSGNLHFFADIGWQSLNTQPTNLGSTETYDTFLIDPKHTREWSGISGAINFDETLFNNDDKAALETVSDHRPAYADFVTNLPDDD